MRSESVRLSVNGEAAEVDVEPRELLSDVLRGRLGLTGTHVGCEQGVCGACTVLVDGQPQRACLIFAVQVDGARVDTIEGVAGPGEELDAVQQALMETHGLQCGFCTPGIVLTVREFLQRNPQPTDDDIREALTGNICRCTGYVNIVAAVRKVAEEQRA